MCRQTVPFGYCPQSQEGKLGDICSQFVSLKFCAIDVSGLRLDFIKELFHVYYYVTLNDAVECRNNFRE